MTKKKFNTEKRLHDFFLIVISPKENYEILPISKHKQSEMLFIHDYLIISTTFDCVYLNLKNTF